MSIRRYNKKGYLKRTIKECLLNMLGIYSPSRECIRWYQGDPKAVFPNLSKRAICLFRLSEYEDHKKIKRIKRS